MKSKWTPEFEKIKQFLYHDYQDVSMNEEKKDDDEKTFCHFHFRRKHTLEEFILTIGIISLISPILELKKLIFYSNSKRTYALFNSEELRFFDNLGYMLQRDVTEATGQRIEDWIYDE